MAQDQPDELRAGIEQELERLRQEHRDLDAAIAALQSVGASDQLQLQRLKKRKLVLRDRIAFLDDQLTPDIIA
ncbi:MAG: YdcH family protein [Beijerinckiaceae bacterium]